MFYPDFVRVIAAESEDGRQLREVVDEPVGACCLKAGTRMVAVGDPAGGAARPVSHFDVEDRIAHHPGCLGRRVRHVEQHPDGIGCRFLVLHVLFGHIGCQVGGDAQFRAERAYRLAAATGGDGHGEALFVEAAQRFAHVREQAGGLYADGLEQAVVRIDGVSQFRLFADAGKDGDGLRQRQSDGLTDVAGVGFGPADCAERGVHRGDDSAGRVGKRSVEVENE